MKEILQSNDACVYFGGLKAVEKVNMTICKGDIFGIIGPNGAGKTTFFNACSGVHALTSGNIVFLGEDVTSLPPEQIARKGLARTFQNIKLFKFMTVLENVKTGFHIRTKSGLLAAMFNTDVYKNDEKMVTEQGKKLLADMGLSAYTDTLANNLPYGLQRKVEIARALALEPTMLMLDEPAAGMNPNETRELSNFILDLHKKGFTIAVIEHDMKFVMSTCNRVLVLNFGKKICEGTPEEIKSNVDVIEAYFGKGFAAKGGFGNG
jgi:branched-chain amino acid transport system ATP-binding protein